MWGSSSETDESGIITDCSHALSTTGSMFKTVSFSSGCVNIKKYLYWYSANTASTSSHASHQKRISSANCLAHGVASLVILPSTTGGRRFMSSPSILLNAAAMGSTLSCGNLAIDWYMRMRRMTSSTLIVHIFQ